MRSLFSGLALLVCASIAHAQVPVPLGPNGGSGGGRTKLNAGLTLWVVKTASNPASSDSNGCTTFATSCLTIAGALAKLNGYDTQGFTVTIQPFGSPATFSEVIAINSAPIGGGNILFNGQGTGPILDANSSSNTLTVQGNANVILQNLTVQNSGSGNAIAAKQSGFITVNGGVTFGSAGASQIDVETSGGMALASSTVSGTSASFIHTNALGSLFMDNAVITCTGNPAYSQYFVGFSGSSYIEAIGATFSGCSGVTGNIFSGNRNATVRTNTNNLGFFPGNAPGIVIDGAMFDDYGGNQFTTTFASLSSTYPCAANQNGIPAWITGSAVATFNAAAASGAVTAMVVCDGSTATWRYH